MDIDLELDYSDRISDFLRSQLTEIKLENAQLETSLHQRHQTASRLREDISKNNSETCLKIVDIQKKIFNEKYIIGLDLRNQSESVAENFTVALDCSSSVPLSYEFHLVSSCPDSLREGLRFDSHINESGQILIVFDIPSYTDHLFFIITGSISFYQNQKNITLKFPSVIKLIPEDITDNSVLINLHKVVENGNDLLSLALTCERREFVIITPPNWSRLLESTTLYKINVKSKRKFFLAYKICPILDGTLLEIEHNNLSEHLQLITYCKNFQVTVMLLHFLHRHITGLIVVPKPLYEPDLTLNRATELFKDSLMDELNHFVSNDSEDFLEKMLELMYQTDILVDKINKKSSS